MKYINRKKISKIFVGREKILTDLQEVLNEKNQNDMVDRPHFVYTLLNTPGIGKTKAVNHFGNSLKHKIHFDPNLSEETVEYALYVYLEIPKDVQSRAEIHENIVKKFIQSFKNFYLENFDIMPNLWKNKLKKPLIEHDDDEILSILYSNYTWKKLMHNPSLFLTSIANTIPIILHYDEFQELIKIDRDDPSIIDKSLYYEMSIFLSTLVTQKLLVILTGTQFTIMNTIGENLGSPLNGKVGKFTLPFLNIDDQKEYISYIMQKPQTQDEKDLISLYENWLIRNGGGHPRTMYYMTDEFLKKIEEYKDIKKFITNYNGFFKDLDKKLYEQLEGLYWKSKYQDLIVKRVGIHDPQEVRQILTYILNTLKMSETGFELGQLKFNLHQHLVNKKDKSKKKRIDNVLEILIQFGYLLINGNDNIYVTSRYALYAFLQDWSQYLPGWSAVFDECMNNPLIWEFILYSPQDFGWNFEVLTKYGLLGPIREMETTKKFPVDFSQQFGKFFDWQGEWVISVPNKYEKIMVNYNISKIDELPEKTYIMLPETTGIDAIIKEEDKIIVIQIATGQKEYINKKFRDFKAYLAKFFQLDTAQLIIPWFITPSEFKLTDKKTENYNGLITNGAMLQEIFEEYENI